MKSKRRSGRESNIVWKIVGGFFAICMGVIMSYSLTSCDELWPPDQPPTEQQTEPPVEEPTPEPGEQTPIPADTATPGPDDPTPAPTEVTTEAPTDVPTPTPNSFFYFEGDTLVIVGPDGLQLRFRSVKGWTYNAAEDRYETDGIIYLGTPLGEIEMEVEIFIAQSDPLYIGATVTQFPFPQFEFLVDSDFQVPVTTLAIASGSELNNEDIGITLVDNRLYLYFTYASGDDFEFSFLDVNISRDNPAAQEGTIIFDVADPMFYVEGDIYGLSCLQNKGVEDIGIGISTQGLIPVESSYELYNGTTWKTYTINSHLYGKGTIPFEIKGIPFELEGNVGINADANHDGNFLGFSDDTRFLDDIGICTNGLLRISPEKYGFALSLDIGAGSAVYDSGEGKLMFYGKTLKNRLFDLIEPVQNQDFQIYGYYDVNTDDLYFKAEGSAFSLIQGYDLRNASLEFHNGNVNLAGEIYFGNSWVRVSGSIDNNGDCELTAQGEWNILGYKLGDGNIIFRKRGATVEFLGNGLIQVGPSLVSVSGHINPNGTFSFNYHGNLTIGDYTISAADVIFSWNGSKVSLTATGDLQIDGSSVRVSGNINSDGTFCLEYRGNLTIGGIALSNVEINFCWNGRSVEIIFCADIRIDGITVRVCGNIEPNGNCSLNYRGNLTIGGYTLSDAEVIFSYSGGSANLTLAGNVGIGNTSVRFSGNVRTDGRFELRYTNNITIGGYTLSNVDARFGWNGNSAYLSLAGDFGIGKTIVRFNGTVGTNRRFSFTCTNNISVDGYTLTNVSVTFSWNGSSASISGRGRITVGDANFDSSFDVSTSGRINNFSASVSVDITLGISGANVSIEGEVTLTIDSNEVEIEACVEVCATVCVIICETLCFPEQCVSVNSDGQVCLDIPLVGRICSIQLL
jgi:hypothetical protein